MGFHNNTSGSGSPSGSAGGDLGGSYPNPTVLSVADITTGTLTATHGGTGAATYASGDTLYSSATNVLSKLTKGTDGQVLTLASGLPSWATASSGVAKQYVGGTSYTNGTPAITIGSGQTATINRCVLVPYQTSDGAWRLRLNISFTLTAASSNNQIEIDTSGILFKNSSNQQQAVAVSNDGVTAIDNFAAAYPNHNYILILFTSSTSNVLYNWSVSGDVELNAKPSWAD